MYKKAPLKPLTSLEGLNKIHISAKALKKPSLEQLIDLI